MFVWYILLVFFFFFPLKIIYLFLITKYREGARAVPVPPWPCVPGCASVSALVGTRLILPPRVPHTLTAAEYRIESDHVGSLNLSFSAYLQILEPIRLFQLSTS